MTLKNKLEEMEELARDHICAQDSVTEEIWNCIGDIDEALARADKDKSYAEAFAIIGGIRERLAQLAQEQDVDPGLSRAARKYELQNWVNDNRTREDQTANGEVTF